MILTVIVCLVAAWLVFWLGFLASAMLTGGRNDR